MNRDQVTEFARKAGYDGAEYRGKWKNFEVYAPVTENEEIANIGKPEFIFVFENIARMATEDEMFEYLDSLPEDEEPEEEPKVGMAKSFNEIMGLSPARTFSKSDPDRFDRIVEIGKFNPYHDSKGRFSSANAAASFTYAPGKSGAHTTAIARETAKGLVASAKAKEPELTSVLSGCAAEAGGEMVGLDFAVKSEESLTRKIKTEMLANGLNAKAAAGEMRDVNRYTIQLKEENFGAGYEATMKTLTDKGYEIVKVKNTLADPNAPYRGINTNLRDKDGSIWELQFHTEKSLEIKEVNHKLYEEQRLDNTPTARRKELDKIMADNAAAIPMPAGVENIANVNKL